MEIGTVQNENITMPCTFKKLLLVCPVNDTERK